MDQRRSVVERALRAGGRRVDRLRRPCQPRRAVGLDQVPPGEHSGLAAHLAELTSHLPERWEDDRPGCARGGERAGQTEFSAVPAYTP